MINEELKAKVKNVIESVSLKLLGRVLPVEVRYRTDMKTSAGYAYRGNGRIDLNTTLFLENIEEFLNDTIPHEVCHLIQFILYPEAKQMHGPEFRSLMSRLGLAGKTYHKYDCSSVMPTRKQFIYVCSCQQFKLSTTMHNKIQAGSNRKCKLCDTIVTLKA